MNISLTETIQKILFISLDTAWLVEIGPVLVIFGARDALFFGVFYKSGKQTVLGRHIEHVRVDHLYWTLNRLVLT